MRILIAEDDPTSRAILVAIVSKWSGHQVAVAETGQAAWTMLSDASRWFDVLFLDQMMPDLTGLEVLQRIRQEPHLQSLEVIMCTAANDRTTITQAIGLGIRHYIVKPATEAVVAAKLQQITVRASADTRR